MVAPRVLLVRFVLFGRVVLCGMFVTVVILVLLVLMLRFVPIGLICHS